jgi:hypothetical protein
VDTLFEYIDGKLVVHHDSSYTVMTNSPIFEKQLALNEYWKQVGGAAMLPGTNRAADRFVRVMPLILLNRPIPLSLRACNRWKNPGDNPRISSLSRPPAALFGAKGLFFHCARC